MSVYSIKDLEHLSGIKAHTIRMWEQRYDLFSPERTATNIRYYSDEDLKLILNIATLRNHGFKISKIVAMGQAELEDEVQEIGLRDKSYEDQISALTLAMIEMDEGLFTDILEKCKVSFGFEKTMIEIIYPFMRKIGILWLTNSVNPAQEHFMTHLIRQKLIAATDEVSQNNEGPLFLLFLPENELHELGLLFANYLLKSRGAKTIFFGQTVPLDALEEVYYKLNPDYILTALTTTPETKEVQSYVKSLSRRFPESQVFITGGKVIGQGLEIPENTTVLNQFEDLMAFMEDLAVKS